MNVYGCVLFCYSQDGKKKFDKESEKYYSILDKHLNLSAKKKESHLQEVSFSQRKRGISIKSCEVPMSKAAVPQNLLFFSLKK